MGALAFASREIDAGPSEALPTAAMMIDGEIVLVSLAFGRIRGKVPCVVVRQDGSLGIEVAWNGLRSCNSGARGGYYDIYNHPESSNGVASIACVIVGTVINRE